LVSSKAANGRQDVLKISFFYRVREYSNGLMSVLNYDYDIRLELLLLVLADTLDLLREDLKKLGLCQCGSLKELA
jgi:hypothetical protein